MHDWLAKCKNQHRNIGDFFQNRQVVQNPLLRPFALRRAFDSFDTDGSGAISAEELAAALEACGLHGTAAEYSTAFKSADKDHNGRVEWEEFKKLGKKKVGAHRLPTRSRAPPHTPR